MIGSYTERLTVPPNLTTRSAWIGHDGELPVFEGMLIRLEVDHLPGGGDSLPVRLWSSKTGAWAACCGGPVCFRAPGVFTRGGDG
jgi:hypothetical protein